MYDQLIGFIKKHSVTPLSADDIGVIKTVWHLKVFRKHQYFLQEGQECKYLGLIMKGAMRQYRVDDFGVKHFIRLSIENWIVGDRESHMLHTPSIYNIDAWEDTQLFQVSRADTVNHLFPIPALNEMARTLDERHAIAAQRRLHSQISLTAEERYNEFIETYPELIQRFPQHTIASYLGMTKETLSRIRKQYRRKLA